MKKLNIGCGRDYREGWENWDISNDVKAERHFDIRIQPWPCADDSVDEIYISGVLEQIGDNDKFIHVMNECHRVLKKSTDKNHPAVMLVVVPNAKFSIAHRDPMDVRKFTADTFAYFSYKEDEYRLYGSVYGFKPWEIADVHENIRHIFTIRMYAR